MKLVRQPASRRARGLRQPSSLTPVADALTRLAAPLRPAPAEPVPVEAAVGRVLAEPIRAPAAVPPRAVAVREGWAVAAADTVGATSYTPMILSSPPPFVRIGAALPPGADAVVPPDAVATVAGFAELTAAVAPGEGARRAGEDASEGATLRGAGERMHAVDAVVARAAGVAVCAVRRARVHVIGKSPAGVLIARFFEAAGATVTHDPLDRGVFDLRRRSEADLIAVVGASDPRAVLSQADAVVADALALRPGEGVGCALAGRAPVLVMPDRLETALAAALVLMRPCLDRLMGAAAEPRAVTAPLLRKLSSTVGLTELALLAETNGGLEPLGAGDITLTAIVRANAWLAIPPESEGVAAGETVRAFVL